MQHIEGDFGIVEQPIEFVTPASSRIADPYYPDEVFADRSLLAPGSSLQRRGALADRHAITRCQAG